MRRHTELRRGHTETLAEALTVIAVTAETALVGHLRDALIGIVGEQYGRIFQAQLLGVVGELSILAAFSEDGTYALFRKLEAVHDGLALEPGIEKEPFTHNDIVDMLEQLLVGKGVEVGYVVGGGYFF